MNRKHIWIALAGLFLFGLILYISGAPRTVTIVIDGQPQTFQTRSMTVAQVLREAGIELHAGDQVKPPAAVPVGWNTTIQVERMVPVYLFVPTQGTSQSFVTTERNVLKLLVEAGIIPSEDDRLFWNGQEIPLDSSLPVAPAYSLQYVPATAFNLSANGQSYDLASAAATLGAALWQAGIHLSTADFLSPPMQTALHNLEAVTLRSAAPITIHADGLDISSRSAAATVGQALAQAGIALENLDYSVPAEDQPIPDDGHIQVVRVREEIVLQQTAIPFESEYVQSDELALGETQVIQEGQTGLKVTRLRVRYEDGTEVSRETEEEWTAREPVTQRVGTGTQVVTNSIDTSSGTLEYWRAITVYATSYSPCRSGADRCYYGTSSGLPVARGVIGVTKEWYKIMAGQKVYVPGYGVAVIGDIGGGIEGKNWIDLAFTDDDFEAWHQDVTMYFLMPVPANAESYP